MKDLFKNYFYPIATLSGTIIGVGFFALPYIASRVGIWTMAGYFLILGFFVFLIHYFYSKVALATPDFLRLPGYAKLHLGNWGKNLALLIIILGSFGSLLAYLIVGGEFLRGLLSGFFGQNIIHYVLLYFFFGAIAILIGVKAIAKIDFWGLILFFGALFFLFFKGMPFFRPENLLAGNLTAGNFFLPFGPIVFSLWGATMVPEIEEMLSDRKKLLPRVILISLLVSALIYALFTIFIVGITGLQTSESALLGLEKFLGKEILFVGFLFGFLATFTSFIAVGLYLKNMLHFDFKVPKFMAGILTSFIPLLLFFMGMKNFISVIGFVGSVMLGVEGILILMMYQKIKTRRLAFHPLIFLILTGIIYEIYYFLK